MKLENLDITEITNEYIAGAGKILGDLQSQINSLLNPSQEKNSQDQSVLIVGQNQDPKVIAARDEIAGYKENEKKFSPNMADLSKHSHLWSGMRGFRLFGRSFGETAIEEDSTECLQDDLDNFLAGLYKSLPSFRNQQGKQVRALIQAARENHAALVKISKESFLSAAKSQLADKLSTSLKKALPTVGGDGIVDIKADIELKIASLKKLSGENLKNRQASLKAHRDVNQLVADVTRYANTYFEKDNSGMRQELLNAAEKFGVITRRYIDPYFENPIEMTTPDKVRYGFKMAFINFGGLMSMISIGLGIGSIFFPPLAIPAAIIGLIGFASMLPVLDMIAEVVYNGVKYGRSPSNEQLKQLGLIVVLLPILTFGGHALVALANALKHIPGLVSAPHHAVTAAKSISAGVKKIALFAKSVGKSLTASAASSSPSMGVKIGRFAIEWLTKIGNIGWQKFVTNGFGSSFSTKASVELSSFLKRKSDVPETVEQINKHPVVPLNAAMGLLLQKKSMPEFVENQSKINNAVQNAKNPNAYYYFLVNSESKAEVVASEHAKIINWKPGFFSNTSAAIIDFYNAYRKLPAGCALQKREEALSDLQVALVSAGNKNKKKELSTAEFTLLMMVNTELAALKSAIAKLPEAERNDQQDETSINKIILTKRTF